MATGGPNKKRQKMDACMIHQCSALLDELKKYPIAGMLLNLQTFDDQELNGILQSRWKSLKDYWHHNPENLTVPLNASDKVEFLKPRQDPVRKLARKDLTSNRRSRSIGDPELPSSQGACKCNSCGSIKCQCTKSDHESMGGKSAADASNKPDFQHKCRAISEYDRHCASDNARLSSQLKVAATVTDETSGEALITSPNRTIPLPMSRKKADQVKKQHEKEKLLRRLCKEEAKVQDLIRAIDAAEKTIRDREREAARIALQKMGNTAGIELNLETQKELMILCGGSLSGPNPLHRLGLFLKHDYSEDTDLYEDIEDHIQAAKTIRDLEREAARIALQKMRNKAGIGLNLETQKEHMILCGGSLSCPNPLHRLCLFLKHDYSEDTDLYEDIEAHIRAAKTIRNREREAARIALQKMRNTGGIELNLETQKELLILCGGSLWGPSPLHRLGLFLKHDYREDETKGNDLYDDIEEGEIVS